MTAKQVKKSQIAAVSVAKELKERTETMLKAVDGSIKQNSFAKLVTRLLEREIEETADPEIAQKRVLEGTMLEDLMEPQKGIRGRKVGGNNTLLS
jgi:hypothetical protein